MDDKWRTLTCGICRGYGITWNPEAWDGTEECDYCNNGTVWLRPKGHAFAYPGGPAMGWYGEDDYKKGKPMMPYEWHAWSASDEEIDKFIVDKNGNFDQDLNMIVCECGFKGSIRQHQAHTEEAEKQFILEHQMYKPKHYKSNIYKAGCLILPVLLFIAACSGLPDKDVDVSLSRELTLKNVTLEDGRTGPCLFWKSGTGQYAIGGISCNWGAFK